MKKITGPAVVLAGQHSGFDPLNPSVTPAHQLSYLPLDVLDEDGKLAAPWVSLGYLYVGRAFISVDLLPPADITARAVETLKQQKTQVLADAHAKATHIEGQIQSLLAIAN